MKRHQPAQALAWIVRRQRRLVALHEEGLIDDDEYAAKRAEILSIV